MMIRLVVALAALSIAPLTHAAPVLEPLTKCPDARASNCAIAGLVWNKAAFRRTSAANEVVTIVSVRGRLDGSAAAQYHLRFVTSPDDYFAQTRHTNRVAVLRTDPLTIFTNAGVLELLDNQLSPESIPNLVIIDDRSRRVLARIYHCADLASFLLPNFAVIWDEGRGKCVSLSRSGATKANGRACRRVPRGECGAVPDARISPEIVPLKTLEATVREMTVLELEVNDEFGAGFYFGGGGWHVSAHRLPQSGLLAIEGYCGDCDE